MSFLARSLAGGKGYQSCRVGRHGYSPVGSHPSTWSSPTLRHRASPPRESAACANSSNDAATSAGKTFTTFLVRCTLSGRGATDAHTVAARDARVRRVANERDQVHYRRANGVTGRSCGRSFSMRGGRRLAQEVKHHGNRCVYWSEPAWRSLLTSVKSLAESGGMANIVP